MQLDFHWILPNLAQGAYPEPFTEAFRVFDVIFLLADDCQAKSKNAPPGKTIVRVPFKDDIYRPVVGETARRFLSASEQAAKHVRAGKRVGITCAAGWNRSGTVTALTVMRLLRMSGPAAIQLVRQRRPRRREPDGHVVYPLMNPMFEQFVLNQRPV